MCHSWSEGWQGNYNKRIVVRIVNVMFLWNSRNQYRVFKLKFFHLSFFWAHIDKVSNINEIMNYNYGIMGKSRYDVILNIPKKKLIWNYLGITLSSCNIQHKFCVTKVSLFFQNSNFSVVILTHLLKWKYRIWKTERSYLGIFSVRLDFSFF